MFRSETIIEVGIVFLLIYTPLVLGARDEISVALLEVVSGILVIVWLAKIFSQRKRPSRHRRGKGKNTKKGHRKMYRLRVIFPPFTWAICLFCALILLQLIPFPGFLVKVFSPSTYHLYSEGVSNTASALPGWLTLSVYTHVTEVELFKFLAYAALFFVMINTIRSPEQIKRFVYIIIAVGFFESIYGFSQLSEGRLSGTFVNKNHFAGYLEMVIPLAFGVLFACLEERGVSTLRKFIHLFEEKYLKAFLMLFVLFVMIAAHLLTGSRGGIISFSLGIMFLCLLAYTRRLFRKWVIVVLIFVLLALGSAVLTNPERILERLGTLAKPESELSFQYRWGVWKGTVLIFRDFPVIGSGLGTFSHIFRRYQRFPSDLFFTHTENDYLQLLTETGVVGTLLMLGVGFVFFYQTLAAWKRQRSRWAIAIGAGGLSALFSLCVHSCVDFNLHLPSNALLFSVVAALSYSAAHAQKTEEQKAESRKQHPASSIQHPASSIQHPVFNLRCSTYYSIIIVAFILVLVYLFRIVESFYAFTCYQQFRDTVALIEGDYISTDASPDQDDSVTRYARKAIRHDKNNAEYYYTLGNYLYQYYRNIRDSEQHDLREQGFREAEVWMQKAVIRDPANPWYYLGLGRLSARRGDYEEADGHHLQGGVPLDSCPTARYFLAALNNAPNNIFLRTQSALWYYRYDQRMAFQLIQEIVSMDPKNTITIMERLWRRIQDYRTLKKSLPDSPKVILEFSKFLYDKHLDYESDLEAEHTLPLENEKSEKCKANFTLQSLPGEEKIELGNDDGSPEWRTYLASEKDRVKKVICLPEDINGYNYTALKIFMNSGVPGEFIAHISINEHLIKRYEHIIPHDPRWHEIPFDKTLLQGRLKITVYVRVTDASASGNFLNIWGDQNTPTTRSIFNFDTIDDLSYDEGIQTGEYMIRLVLKK